MPYLYLMYISVVFAMKIFRLIKIFSNSIKNGGKTVQKVNIDTRDSVGREWEMAEGERQRIKDRGKKSKHTGNKKQKIIC